VDDSPYLGRIRAVFPSLAIASARVNSDGLANDAVIVNDELVFRFPKTGEARELMAYELAALDVARRYVTLPLPEAERAAEDFVRYRFLPGEPLYRSALLRADEAGQEGYAAELALFLRQLHGIPLHELPLHPHFGARGGANERYRERLEEIRAVVYPLLWRDQRDWVEDLFAPVVSGALDLDGFAPAFIHRDLASYHILHDPQGARLAGVIDFGTAGAGDPAVDLGNLINTYGESFVRRMRPHYPLDRETLERARFLAGAIELEWALNGLRSDDRSWFLVHLGRARDVLPFGVA
jgi:aminoglycoside 2''-phosphotransferase